MERPRWPSASRGGKAPRKRRCPSPLPGAAPLPVRAGASQPCRRRLFGSVGLWRPEPASLKGKSSLKTLPKIKENLEVTKVSSSCNQSNQVNVKETTDLEKNEEKIEESAVPLKESLTINFESKESLKNDEVTSSTGMTLPTGVSTFLLECLDVDSSADYNTGASVSLNSFSSPETFRDDDSEERSNFHPENKNSTLLDSSKAVAIDKIPQISNLSAILEPVVDAFQDQNIRSQLWSLSRSELICWKFITGKKVCKITAATEGTPDLKTGMRCSSPLGPERKPDNQTAETKKLKCKRKGRKPNTAGEGSSSFRQLDAPGNASAKAGGLTEVLPPQRTGAVMQRSSTMLIMEENKAVKNLCFYQPVKPDAVCGRPKLCSIIRTSPCHRLRPIPVNTQPFRLPEGLPEDSITNIKNWTCCKPR
ncbi:PREDICTED: meiosis-specific kinetochore protein [Calidris pugnax]|uniref:meiosis-specific kinetochore protein n=1 Tax=Calidris pugnax TaxID=198806 RepID=UPI00071DBFC4|nr:PREDICTED: meiosis-specific kinetochore protein [Calidris pugnax]